MCVVCVCVRVEVCEVRVECVCVWSEGWECV